MSMDNTGQQTDRSLTHAGECEKCEYVWERKGQVLRRKRKRGRNSVEEKRRDDLIHKSSSSRAFLFCSTSPHTTRYYDIYVAETGITTADSKSFFRSSGRLDRIRTINYINLIVARVSPKAVRD